MEDVPPITSSDSARNPDHPEELEKPNPFQDPLLRREAGEGWHPSGLNKRFLGAIVAREAIGGALGTAHENDDREAIQEEYATQCQHVEKLRDELGIGYAPPRTDT